MAYTKQLHGVKAVTGRASREVRVVPSRLDCTSSPKRTSHSNLYMYGQQHGMLGQVDHRSTPLASPSMLFHVLLLFEWQRRV
jgi:hypothetical protein